MMVFLNGVFKRVY